MNDVTRTPDFGRVHNGYDVGFLSSSGILALDVMCTKGVRKVN